MEGADIVYTYDVEWKESDITWVSRWDAYLKMPGGKVHWFSILNSIMVILVMACIVAMILLRTIRRDLARYEQLIVDSGMDFLMCWWVCWIFLVVSCCGCCCSVEGNFAMLSSTQCATTRCLSFFQWAPPTTSRNLDGRWFLETFFVPLRALLPSACTWARVCRSCWPPD